MKHLSYWCLLLMLFPFLSKADDHGSVQFRPVSQEINQVSGSFTLTYGYHFEHAVTVTNQTATLPTGWSHGAISQLNGQSFHAEDSTTASYTISYDPNNLPFYPQAITFQVSVSEAGGDPETFQGTAMIYFTPYGSVEIWSLHDFQNLPRKWHTPKVGEPEPQRVTMAQSAIPVTNIDPSYEIDWDNRDWDYGMYYPEFWEQRVAGLPYDVLMMPLTKAEIDSIGDLGDGLDSVSVKANYTGTVTGSLWTTIDRDLDTWDWHDIPLGGIEVRIYDEDQFWNQHIATGFTDANGNFSISYDVNQVFEGNNLELFVRMKSRTSDHFKIRANGAFGNVYEADFDGASAPSGATTNVGICYMLPLNFFGPYSFGPTVPVLETYAYEAFSSVHWINKSFQCFENESLNPEAGCRININAWGTSHFFASFNRPALHFFEGHALTENTPYHEVGHVLMYLLQDDTFTWPFGTDAFNHSWSEENTSLMTWVEGWATGIQFILDAYWQAEDGEAGYEEGGGSWPQSELTQWGGSLEKGLRFEYFVATMIYDLWDGPDKGLPNPHVTRVGAWGTPPHGWDDTENPFASDYRSFDDVSLSLWRICKPLLDNQNGDKLQSIQGYFSEMQGYYTGNQKMRSDLSRIFRENQLVWNRDQYNDGEAPRGMASDAAKETQLFLEVTGGTPNIGVYPTWYVLSYSFTDPAADLNFPTQSGDNPITDELWVGNNDGGTTARNLYLNQNSSGGGPTNSYYSVYGHNLIDVRNGDLVLGGSGRTAHLDFNHTSMLRVRSNGDVIVENGSQLVIEPGASLQVHSGATLTLNGNATIRVKAGAHVCIHENANIELNGSSSQLILEPGAIQGVPTDDFYDGNLWPSPNNCGNPGDYNTSGPGTLTYECEDFYPYSYTTDYTASSGTWTSDVSFKEDLIIPAGVTLNMNGMTATFAPGARIIIEQTAVLNVDGSVLTGVCDQRWRGIEVWGDRFEKQTTSYQGKLLVKNNSVIEHAENAVTTKRSTSGGWDYNSTGGIVNVSNSTFRDNGRDVEFLSYHYHPSTSNPTIEISNVSRFTLTTFTTTDNYRGLFGFAPHVTMWDVNGVAFRGCTFKDDRTNFFIPSSGRTGLYTIDASYSINEHCSTIQPIGTFTCNGTPTTFVDHKYGIQSFGLNRADKSIFIRNTDFDCWNGAYLSGIDNATIQGNEFDVTTWNDYIMNFNYPYGLYLETCDAYKLEQNDFYSNATSFMPSLVGGSIGLVVKDNGRPVNEVYRNTFKDLVVGIECIGVNRGAFFDDGLKIKCNDFVDNRQDIWVTDDLNNPSGDPLVGISPGQGFTLFTTPTNQSLAGNTFANASPILTENFNNDGTWVYYVHHDVASESRVVPSINSDISLYNITIDYDQASCPSHISTGHVLHDLKMRKSTLGHQIEAARYSLSGRVDNGSSSQLANQIAATSSQNAYDMYLELMGISPYLSDAALEQLSRKEEGLNASMLRDVMVANPQAGKSKVVMDNLARRINRLQGYMITQIEGGQGQLGSREMADLQISEVRNNYDLTINEAMGLLVNDDVNDNFADIKDLLGDVYSLNAQIKLVDLYYATGDKNQAEQLLNAIPNVVEFTGRDQDHYNDLVSYYNMVQTWKQNGTSLDRLADSDVSALNTMAQKDGPVAVRAQALLVLNDAWGRVEPVYLPTESSGKSLTESPSDAVVPTDYLELFPNPAVDYTTVSYKSEGAGTFQLTDMSGRLVLQQAFEAGQDEQVLDIRELPSGSYLGTMYVDGKPLGSAKLSIVR